LEEKNEVAEAPNPATSPTYALQPARRVLADGTYATESAFSGRSAGANKAEDKKQKQPLRGELAYKGDTFWSRLTRRYCL
jgi:hypothetical protein